MLGVLHALGGLQRAEPLRMLTVYGLPSAKIGDRQRENWKLIWGLQTLGVKRVVAKFVLRLLLPEQKDRCAPVANDPGRTV